LAWRTTDYGKALFFIVIPSIATAELAGRVEVSQLAFTDGGEGPGWQRVLEVAPIFTTTTEGGLRVLAEPVLVWWDPADAQPEFDLLRAKLDYAAGSIDLTLGSDVVFWGVTEGVQLSNIINQRDLAADFEGDTSLGQPMVRLGWQGLAARLDLFYLPWMPERRFRSPAERLNNAVSVDDDPMWPTAREAFEPGFAMRASGTFDAFDVGAYVFRGLNRRPTFVPDADGTLRPSYAMATQYGFDGQWIWRDLILKGELRHATEAPQTTGTFSPETAWAVGGEYAFYGLADTTAEVAAFVEYAHSSQGSTSLNIYQDDLLIGARVQVNDFRSTELRIALVHDTEFGSNVIEADLLTRVSERVSVSLSYNDFSGLASSDPYAGFRDDSVVSLGVAINF
jgi:hypothetical protein